MTRVTWAQQLSVPCPKHGTGRGFPCDYPPNWLEPVRLCPVRRAEYLRQQEAGQ